MKGHIEKWQAFKESAEHIYFQNPSRVIDAQIQVSQIHSEYKKLGCTSIELRVPIAPQVLQQFEKVIHTNSLSLLIQSKESTNPHLYIYICSGEQTIIEKPLDQLVEEELKNFKPESIVEIGCGLGWTGAILRSLYPSAKFACIDLDINEDIANIQQFNLATILGQPIHALAPSALPARTTQVSHPVFITILFSSRVSLPSTCSIPTEGD